MKWKDLTYRQKHQIIAGMREKLLAQTCFTRENEPHVRLVVDIIWTALLDYVDLERQLKTSDYLRWSDLNVKRIGSLNFLNLKTQSCSYYCHLVNINPQWLLHLLENKLGWDLYQTFRLKKCTILLRMRSPERDGFIALLLYNQSFSNKLLLQLCFFMSMQFRVKEKWIKM